MNDEWRVVRAGRKYTVAFFDEEGQPEYANVKYDTPQEAQRFADAANEMVRGNIYGWKRDVVCA